MIDEIRNALDRAEAAAEAGNLDEFRIEMIEAETLLERYGRGYSNETRTYWRDEIDAVQGRGLAMIDAPEAVRDAAVARLEELGLDGEYVNIEGSSRLAHWAWLATASSNEIIAHRQEMLGGES